MPYRVELTRHAELDALEAADWIARESRVAAERWFRELERVVASLEESPNRFVSIPEDLRLRYVYRSVHHYSHRVIYRVDEDARTVYVVRVYHGARRSLRESDLRE